MYRIFGRALASMCARGILGWLPDKQYLQLYYFGLFGKWIDFKNPETFNEKLQWLKLYDRKEIYTTMVDKNAVKDYVAGIIGNEFIIPTLGVWDRFDDIDFDKLPSQFVLKTTHDSGGVCICKDKSTFDYSTARNKLNASLKHDFYRIGREWPYKNVRHQIIAEEYIDAENQHGLDDYKVHCFNGEPKVILVCKDRFSEIGLTEDFFTPGWRHLNVKRPEHNNAEEEPEYKPEVEEMLRLARKLSKNIPFLRTDFYTIDNKIYFGELTFFPASGFEHFEPESFDYEMGNWIALPIEGGVILYKDNMYLFISSDSPSNEQSGLNDYKFFCFDGKVKFFKIDFDRQTRHRANYYDRECRLLEIEEVSYPRDPEKTLYIPQNINAMISLAEKLSSGNRFLRVDFYNVNGRIYFGELTFFPASGFGAFGPQNADKEIGSYLKLPL